MSDQSKIVGQIKEGLELFRRRNFGDAEAEFLRIVAIWPNSFYGWFHLGRTLFYLGKLDEAKVAFQKALNANLQLASNWLNTGQFCDESIGHQTEETCLSEYLYEHERDGDIRKMLAEIFYDNRSIVTKDHCFDETAVSESDESAGEDKDQVLIKRRNCHVTTH